MSLYEIVLEFCPEGWETFFGTVIRQIKEISEVLDVMKEKYGRYVPNNDRIFTLLYYIKPSEIKAVIIGQDPYFKLTSIGETEAQGIAFSLPTYHTINSSLRNMYKELSDDNELEHKFNIPDHGCLIEWLKQGVLLMNVHLTTTLGKPGAHAEFNFWLQFTIPFLKKLVSDNKKLIFIVLGRDAKAATKYLDNKGIIIEAAHPSGANINGGFLGSKVFSKCNKELIKQNKTPIDWRISPKSQLNI